MHGSRGYAQHFYGEAPPGEVQPPYLSMYHNRGREGTALAYTFHSKMKPEIEETCLYRFRDPGRKKNVSTNKKDFRNKEKLKSTKITSTDENL